MTSTLDANSPDGTIAVIDPWTVYGDVAAGEALAINVADIGVLPPPGRYLCSVSLPRLASAAAVVTVPARTDSDPERRERALQAELSGLASWSAHERACVTFEACVLPADGRRRPG